MSQTSVSCSFDKNCYEIVNPSFAKVRIRIAHDGPNRNGTNFPREVLEEMAENSLRNTPIVGEWSEEKQNFLGHGGKIVMDDEGIRFLDTTQPYGFVPESSEIYWEEILDIDGITKHNYLCCTGYLWHGRYPQVMKVLEDGSNQSMEVYVYDSEEDGDSLVVKRAEFSALCILGKDDYHPKDSDESTEVEPCFEEAQINRYSKKFNFALNEMIGEYKKSFEPEGLDNSDENYGTEVNNLENKLDLALVKASIQKNLNGMTYRSNTDHQYNKYEILSVDNDVVHVVDREDDYRVYAIPYMATEIDENIVVNVSYDARIEKSFAIGEKTNDAIFNINGEICKIAENMSDHKVAIYTAATIADISSKYEDVKEQLERMSLEADRLKKQLAVFEEEKEQLAINKHRETIDGIVSTWKNTIGDDIGFCNYCNTIDYNKDISVIETELKLIYADYARAKEGKGKKQFSALTTNVSQPVADHNEAVARWGADIVSQLGGK